MFADSEAVIYGWLKTLNLQGANVWLSMPTGPRTFPAVLAQRIGGAPTFAGDWAQFQFDCFASGTDIGPSNALAYRLASFIDAAVGRPVSGGQVESITRISDKDAPYTRTVLTALLFVRPLNAES